MVKTISTDGVNLSDLAEKYGSDKGPAKHRYTELYNMLFHPYRDQPIRFLEMGLFIGGPEHGISADRETTDLPSVRMWLEFFSQAQIHGLDVSDFSWFEHPRFSFTRCDMDRRENIRDAFKDAPPFDIIIDDASHASHHQQFALLELFPKLKPGGLYIIEDLRWQPQTYERAGITKTADLFQSYLHHGSFRHSDPALAAEFDALRPEISGAFLHQVRYLKEKRDQVLVIHKR
ncbi:class I SAM-dependent methyltransferase [Sinorhodobacter sp. B57]|nr:class I SAM-dependent methyltransferase [Sedimentimonas flavescens]